nr:MAG TPA: hypothetical protein [Caudoviricetes sp.]
MRRRCSTYIQLLSKRIFVYFIFKLSSFAELGYMINYFSFIVNCFFKFF